MKNSLESLGKGVFYTVIGVVAVIVLIFAIVAGMGLISGLFIAFIFAVAIFFGSIGELAASIVVGYLLKAFAPTIHDFVGVWWTGAAAEKFFSLVTDTGYFKLIIVIFFFAYTISFFTSRVKLFNICMGGKIESATKEE